MRFSLLYSLALLVPTISLASGIIIEGVSQSANSTQYMVKYIDESGSFRTETYSGNRKGKNWDSLAVSQKNQSYLCTRKKRRCVRMGAGASQLMGAVGGGTLGVLKVKTTYHKLKLSRERKKVGGKKCRMGTLKVGLSVEFPMMGEKSSDGVARNCYYKPKRMNYRKLCAKVTSKLKRSLRKSILRECMVGIPIYYKMKQSELPTVGRLTTVFRAKRVREKSLSSRLFSVPKGYKIVESPFTDLADMTKKEEVSDLAPIEPIEEEERARRPRRERRGVANRTAEDIRNDTESEINKSVRKKANTEVKKVIGNVLGF